MSTGSAQDSNESRIRKQGLAKKAMARPELGAAVGLFLVWTLFAILAHDRGFITLPAAVSYLQVAAGVGIVAVSITLLMIAGEFDLSVGSQIGFLSVFSALLIGRTELPIELVILMTLLMGAFLGFINGFLIVRTGLPSFLITLAGLFIYRGLAIGMTLTIAGSPVLGGLKEEIGDGWVVQLFTAVLPGGFNMAILWWVGLTLIGTLVLSFTRFGNWIQATGGHPTAARQVGVPVDRVKVILFAFVGISAAIAALIGVMQFGSAEAGRGAQKEFEAIITAVIGGTLLTGGIGSPTGTVFGALILAIVRQGLFFVGVDVSWYQAILGLVLLASVMINHGVRTRVK